MDTQKTRSSAPQRASAPASTATPAPSRAAQARLARAQEGRPAPSGTAGPAPVRDGYSGPGEEGAGEAGALLSGLEASFRPEGEWGQGFLGGQAQWRNSGVDAQVQFSLDTPRLQANGAGEARAEVNRQGALAQGQIHGLASLDGKDTDFEAGARAALFFGPRLQAEGGLQRNPDGSTTVGGSLVLPTPFGFSLGGGVRLRYSSSEP